jgi:hypothetical protein
MCNLPNVDHERGVQVGPAVRLILAQCISYNTSADAEGALPTLFAHVRLMLQALDSALLSTMQPDSLLLQLPPELAASVWDALGRTCFPYIDSGGDDDTGEDEGGDDEPDLLVHTGRRNDDRKNLWGTSRKGQELFAPAVKSTVFGLRPEDPEVPDPFRCLHPTVRLKKLTVQSWSTGWNPHMKIGYPWDYEEDDTFTLFCEYASGNTIMSSLEKLRVQASALPEC